MVRASASEVLQVLDEDPGPAVHAALLAADRIIDDQFPPGSNVPDDTLREIERYLAAHIVTVAHLPAGVRSMGLGGESEVYGAEGASQVLGTLGSTRHGQIAVLLDPTGRLSDMAKPHPHFAVL